MRYLNDPGARDLRPHRKIDIVRIGRACGDEGALLRRSKISRIRIRVEHDPAGERVLLRRISHDEAIA